MVARASRHRFVPPALRPYSEGLSRGLRDAHYRAMNAISRVNPDPIFVLGNQKSGTTAVAALFARLTRQTVTLDLTREVWKPSYHRIATGDLGFDEYIRRNRWGFSREVIKEPNLTLFLPRLAESFPGARYLFVLRDPRDNIRSLLDRLGIPGDLPRLEPEWTSLANPRYNPGLGLVMDARWYGIPGDHYVDHLAHRWRTFYEIYAANAARLVPCRYEDFLADKVGTLRGLAGALRCASDGDVSRHLDRDFQSRGDHSLTWREFFGEQALARIERICAAGMEALGYPSTG